VAVFVDEQAMTIDGDGQVAQTQRVRVPALLDRGRRQQRVDLVPVQDRWAIRVAELLGPGIDHLAPEAVQGVDGHVTSPAPQLMGDLLTQHPRSLGAEGDGQHGGRIHLTLQHQIGDAPGERGGFPTPWSGDDRQRTVASGDGTQLIGGEAVGPHPRRRGALRRRSQRGSVSSCQRR
jgi:hypothetical protein